MLADLMAFIALGFSTFHFVSPSLQLLQQVLTEVHLLKLGCRDQHKVCLLKCSPFGLTLIFNCALS